MRVAALTARVVAFALLCTALVVPAASAATPQTTLPDVEDEVMCTICGTLLELSESPQADRERALIQRLIDDGKTKDEIKDELVAQYGSEVLATPSGGGFDLAAWIVPGLAIAVALAGLILAAFRLRRRSAADPPREPQLDPGDVDRLDRDLSSYDL